MGQRSRYEFPFLWLLSLSTVRNNWNILFLLLHCHRYTINYREIIVMYVCMWWLAVSRWHVVLLIPAVCLNVFFPSGCTHCFIRRFKNKSDHLMRNFMIVQWVNLLLSGKVIHSLFSSLLGFKLSSKIQFKICYREEFERCKPHPMDKIRL